MKSLNEQERQLLTKISNQYDLPIKLLKVLKKSAIGFSYSNTSQAERRKEYLGLISYYSKKGDK